MSGYLEVKYPLKSNIGLNPFKSWKRQWCILRPSPTSEGGGSLAVYCSEAGAPAGTVELPSSCMVRRAKSRTRPFAFAVFAAGEPRKPRILLAAQTFHDAQLWMEKVTNLINGKKLLGTEILLKDSYSVTIVTTELSRKCGMHGDSVLTLSSNGLIITRPQALGSVLEWKCISDILLMNQNEDKNRTCVLTMDSDFNYGSGVLKLLSPMAGELVATLKQALKDYHNTCPSKKLSKSEGDLRSPKCSDPEIGDVRRSSWYSGPSEVSLDDIDLLMSKEAKRIPSGQLSRCNGAGDLTPTTPITRAQALAVEDSISDRRSLASVASGIYEEIPDLPPPPSTSDLYCPMSRDVFDGIPTAPIDTAALSTASGAEPAYESVAECAGRARRPPPLPPRLPSLPKAGAEWGECVGGCVTRHGSLGSLPPVCSGHCRARTLPKHGKHSFSVFRKRLKSDSRLASSPKSETTKDKDVETKKKKFDFTPTRDIFKSFKVSRKMKGLKIATGLAKGEAKSCEFLDEQAHEPPNRCAKSVECLEQHYDDYDADLSIEFNDEAITTLALPQEIVDLILAGREQFKIRLKDTPENDYLPMSPIIPPPPIEHQYMVMSPRTNLA